MDKYGNSELDDININEIIEILDDVEIIAHDKTIDFDSAKHILDDEKMDLINFELKQTIKGPKVKIYQELFCDVHKFHLILLYFIFCVCVV